MRKQQHCVVSTLSTSFFHTAMASCIALLWPCHMCLLSALVFLFLVRLQPATAPQFLKGAHVREDNEPISVPFAMAHGFA